LREALLSKRVGALLYALSFLLLLLPWASAGQNIFDAHNVDAMRTIDENKFATARAFCAEKPGGEVYIPAGTYTPASPIACRTPTNTRGAGVNQTIIKPTAALASALFVPSGAGEGYAFADLTIDMSDAPTVGAIMFTGQLRPVLRNVRIIYPATTGTGTAIFKSNTGETHASDLMIKGAGICVDINGDAGQEDFWSNVACEDPGSFGYRLLRTTVADIGGQYLNHFKVTNPDNRAGAQAFLISSTAANTGQPFFCVQCVGDNMRGGHTYQFNNVVNIFLDGIWSTNGGAIGSNFAAVDFQNVTNGFLRGGYLASMSRDVVLSGTATTIALHHNFFGGTNTNLYVSGATLNNISLVTPIFTATIPASAADMSAIINAANAALSANGWHVGVSGSQGAPQTLSLCDKDVGDAAPCIYQRATAGGGGSFQILNNAFAQIFAVNQSGTVATIGASGQLCEVIGTGSVITPGTVVRKASCQSQTNILVTGALSTDSAVANLGALLPGTWQTGIQYRAEVTAPNIVTVYLCNPTASEITPAATAVHVRVIR
jgi:hypothetical protein